MNERRVNLRTVALSTRARLETKVEERYGWALSKSHEEVRELKTKLDDEQYAHQLAKEALLFVAGEKTRTKGQCMRLCSELPHRNPCHETPAPGLPL
jgi:hypothetical protein